MCRKYALPGGENMEQMTMLEETLQTKMAKQMKIAIRKGIVPGAKVILDKDENVIYTVIHLYCGHGEKLEAYLRSKLCDIGWEVSSKRLTTM